MLTTCLYTSHFTESRSNPDEDRLRKQLFDPEHQTYDLMTPPVANVYEPVKTSIYFVLIKLIGVVKTVVRIYTVSGIRCHCIFAANFDKC